jgi:tetratricopeptide (TPR) repeat protein
MHVRIAFAGIYRSRGLLKQSLEIQTSLLEFVRTYPDLDPWERGLAYREYAWTKQIVGDFETALVYYNLAMQEFKQDKVALNSKDSRQAREFANLLLLRAYFYFEILDFNQASQELDSAFLACNDKEVKDIALGLKEIHMLIDKPFTPALVQNAIKAMELIAPGAGKDIDFLSIVQVLSKSKGVALFGQKDIVALSGDINSSFRKYLGDNNFFTLLGESQIGLFLLRNGKTKEGFIIFDKVIAKIEKNDLVCSPSFASGVLSPYTDFALDVKDASQLAKINKINKEFHGQTQIKFGKKSQAALHASCYYCNSLLSMKKHEEAIQVMGEVTENLQSSNNQIFPIFAIQVLKLMDRLDVIDQNNELLKNTFTLFNKRVSADFKSTVRYHIKERIAAIEKKLQG